MSRRALTRSMAQGILLVGVSFAVVSCFRKTPTPQRTMPEKVDNLNLLRLEILTAHGDKGAELVELQNFTADKNPVVRRGAYGTLGTVAAKVVGSDRDRIVNMLAKGLDDPLVILDPGNHPEQIDRALARLANTQSLMQRMNAALILEKFPQLTPPESAMLTQLSVDPNPAVSFAASHPPARTL